MESELQLDEKAKEAVTAAKNAAYAVELARQAQISNFAVETAQKAAEVASERIKEKIIDEQRMAIIVKHQVENVLLKGTEQERSMILARVPYICQDIKKTDGRLENIEQSIQDIKENVSTFPLIQKLVFGLVGAILAGAVSAMGWAVVMALQYPK